MGDGEDVLVADFAVDVIDFIEEVELFDLLGEEVVDVGLDVVAAAGEDVLILGGFDGGDHHDAGEGRTAGSVVEGQLLFDDGGFVGAVDVAEFDAEVVDAVGEGESLHVEEVEVVEVGGGDARAFELVLVGVLDGVALGGGDDDLDGGLIAVAVLDKVEVPGVEGEIGFDIGTGTRLIEGAVGEDGGELTVLSGSGEGAADKEGCKKEADCFFHICDNVGFQILLRKGLLCFIGFCGSGLLSGLQLRSFSRSRA